MFIIVLIPTINTIQYGCLISWGPIFRGVLSIVIYEAFVHDVLDITFAVPGF